jgi:hypothetical protein
MRTDRYAYTDAAEQAFQLEALLKRWGISIRSGSVLEAATLGSVDILERRQIASRGLVSAIDWRDDLRSLVSNVVGVTEVAT